MVPCKEIGGEESKFLEGFIKIKGATVGGGGRSMLCLGKEVDASLEPWKSKNRMRGVSCFASRMLRRIKIQGISSKVEI